MKKEQKFSPKAKFATIELGRTMKAYAPFDKKVPKGEGTSHIDTGYELVNNRQIRTTRAITCTVDERPSYRATDSYPVLVDMGQVYLNPAGTAWVRGEDGYFTPNAPAEQVELACTNIMPYIRDKMYTDLEIINVRPTFDNAADYPTTVWPRYFEALAINSKIIIKAFMKYARMMSYAKWLASFNVELLSRINHLIKETQRARFVSSMEQLNLALKQMPIHADIVTSFIPLFTIQVDNDEYSGCPTYVDPQILPYVDANMDDLRAFCSVTNYDLILHEDIIEAIENAPDVDNLVEAFFTLPFEAEDEDDYAGWVVNTINTYRNLFNHLANAIGAIAERYQPLTTALIKIGDVYFGNRLYKNFSLETMGMSHMSIGTDFYVYNFLNGSVFQVGEGDLNRTVSGIIPLFNSFSPIDLFAKNGILTAVPIHGIEDNHEAYTPLLDVSGITLRRAWFFNALPGEDDTWFFEYDEFIPGVIPNTNLYRIESLTPNGQPHFNAPVLDDEHPKAATRMKDLGFIQFLKAHFVEFYIGDEYHVHNELSGYRVVNYEPITEYIISAAPQRFGVSTPVVKNITG